jgi:hypothetical protein
MQKLKCKLPGGFIDQNGVLQQEAELVPFSGYEEELLCEKGNRASATLVTVLLSRCVLRIGNICPVSEEVVRALLVADRQYLLIKLREVTFGNTIKSTIACPWPDCGKKVDIDFTTNDLPVRESAEKGPFYTMELSREAAWKNENGQEYREIRFRLPNGGDQEVVAPLLPDNDAKALSALLERCVIGIGQLSDVNSQCIMRFSPVARREIERKMEAVAPKVDMTMTAVCPECGREFTAPFDLQDFFFGEFRANKDLLYREVHYLAFHYHWSEREIMGMTKDKRQRYIDVLADEIEKMNYAT